MLVSETKSAALTNHLLALPAWRHGDVLGAKLVSVFPENAPPTPSIQTVYVLFDGRDGSPLACITGSTFTLRKTAADSALGASFLARADAAELLMVGAGSQAPHQIAALQRGAAFDPARHGLEPHAGQGAPPCRRARPRDRRGGDR